MKAALRELLPDHRLKLLTEQTKFIVLSDAQPLDSETKLQSAAGSVVQNLFTEQSSEQIDEEKTAGNVSDLTHTKMK